MKTPAKNLHINRKRKAMALPLTLIVLLVTGALVGISLYLIENMKTTTDMKAHDEARLNAALAGVERGKQWLLEQVDAGGDLPALVEGREIEPPDFEGLLVRDPIVFEESGARITVRIYDVTYDINDSLKFEPGFPPRIFQVADGGSLKASQSYASSNAAEGSTGAGSPDSARLGCYVIRSEVEMMGIVKRVEQAVLLRR